VNFFSISQYARIFSQYPLYSGDIEKNCSILKKACIYNCFLFVNNSDAFRPLCIALVRSFDDEILITGHCPYILSVLGGDHCNTKSGNKKTPHLKTRAGILFQIYHVGPPLRVKGAELIRF
jgi:hypothetical protein